MSNICAVKPCTRTARALCHCCQQNVCIVHLTEHNDVLINQLNPLIDITNRLSQRLQTIDLDKTFANCRKKLELWRLESHKKIDEFFEQKFHQLDLLINDKINEQQEDINLIQLKIQELIREQQITRQDINDLTLTIDQIEKTINQFDNKFLDIHTYPLILDNNLISIRGINEQEYNLSMLSPIYKIINLSEGSYDSICSNDRYLLIHQSPNLCLIDKDLSIYKRTQWRYEIIYDICWSITLNNFIILDQKNLYLLDENTMSIEKIKINDKKKWISCTCSEKHLFLSTNEWGSSITKFDLTPTKKLDKQFQSPPICKPDEFVDIITYKNEKLAMIIRNNTSNGIRIEVRASETLVKVWLLPLDLGWNPRKPFHCCPFIQDDWIIADYEKGRLLHITKSGRIKSVISYHTIPYGCTLFGPNVLAVSTKNGINFHDLNHKKTYTLYVV